MEMVLQAAEDQQAERCHRVQQQIAETLGACGSLVQYRTWLADRW
jgi:hypothetical protein